MRALHWINTNVIGRLGIVWGIALAILQLVLAGEDGIVDNLSIFLFLFLMVVASLFVTGSYKEMRIYKADGPFYFCLMLFFTGMLSLISAMTYKNYDSAFVISFVIIVYSIVCTIYYYVERTSYLLLRDPDLEKVFRTIPRHPLNEENPETIKADSIIQAIRTYGYTEDRMAALLPIVQKTKHVPTMISLAEYYKEKEEEKHAYWLKMAAVNGDKNAAYEYAKIMDSPSKNRKDAYIFYAVSYRDGKIKACDSLAKLQYTGDMPLKDAALLCVGFLGLLVAFSIMSIVLPALLGNENKVVATIAQILFAIFLNIINYKASYKWHMRKEWFFWVGLAMSIYFFAHIILF